VHPFEDGNDRLGRAIFDLALAQKDPSAGGESDT
jgi:Fic family protein